MKNVHNLLLIVSLSSYTLEFQNIWEMDLKMKYYSNKIINEKFLVEHYKIVDSQVFLIIK
jgi:hypothetical protein